MSERAARRSRVLVVDDEPGVRESLRVILSGDHEVVTASSGEQALAVIEHEPVDVVTLDLNMPGLGGVTVLQRAKEVDPEIEVLIITGNGSLDTAVEGLRLRAFDYIAKPFDAGNVRRLVQTAAARRAAMRRMKTVPEQLLSSLSQELRTPLAVILGSSSILAGDRPGDMSEEQRAALDRIQSNTTSLLAYVETIVYMAELDRGTVPFAVAPVDVAALLGRVGEELAPRAAEKGVAWHLDVVPGLLVRTDEDKLHRLVRALADNAVRFTTAGEVRVTARRAGGGMTLQVEDTGPGLDTHLINEAENVVAGRAPERSPRLLGFGLRLASRLARALGAVMTIAASPTGTSCKLIVPDRTAAPSPTAEPA
jgi:signal transduction histidine kinase